MEEDKEESGVVSSESGVSAGKKPAHNFSEPFDDKADGFFVMKIVGFRKPVLNLLLVL